MKSKVEAARLLGVGVEQIDKYVRDGYLKKTLQPKVVFSEEDIEACKKARPGIGRPRKN